LKRVGEARTVRLGGYYDKKILTQKTATCYIVTAYNRAQEIFDARKKLTANGRPPIVYNKLILDFSVVCFDYARSLKRRKDGKRI
jgi:hypothetical protein